MWHPRREGVGMTDPLGTYVIAAGGTGGHIIPGIALATEIRTHKPERGGPLRRDRSGSRAEDRSGRRVSARARRRLRIRRQDLDEADRRARQDPPRVPRVARAPAPLPRAGRDRGRRLRHGSRADGRALARHTDGDPRVERPPRRVESVPEQLRDADGRRSRRRQRAPQEAGSADRHARAPRVLRRCADEPRPRRRGGSSSSAEARARGSSTGPWRAPPSCWRSRASRSSISAATRTWP